MKNNLKNKKKYIFTGKRSNKTNHKIIYKRKELRFYIHAQRPIFSNYMLIIFNKYFAKMVLATQYSSFQVYCERDSLYIV